MAELTVFNTKQTCETQDSDKIQSSITHGITNSIKILVTNNKYKFVSTPDL